MRYYRLFCRFESSVRQLATVMCSHSQMLLAHYLNTARHLDTLLGSSMTGVADVSWHKTMGIRLPVSAVGLVHLLLS